MRHTLSQRAREQDIGYHSLSPAQRAEQEIRSNPNVVKQAREAVELLDIPGTPDVTTARRLLAAGLPDWCGIRHVLDLDVTSGRPEDGTARSDDHIGYFEVELPFEEIDSDMVSADVCGACGCDRAIYVYSATHFIAGYERVYCPECETEYHSEEWG